MGDYRSKYEDAPITPLYPFGYGLSYTTFNISNVQLNSATLSKGGKITVTAQVANTGKRDGEIVVQLYIRDLVGSVTPSGERAQRLPKKWLSRQVKANKCSLKLPKTS